MGDSKILRVCLSCRPVPQTSFRARVTKTVTWLTDLQSSSFAGLPPPSLCL